jgi:hypothetical protein
VKAPGNKKHLEYFSIRTPKREKVSSLVILPFHVLLKIAGIESQGLLALRRDHSPHMIPGPKNATRLNNIGVSCRASNSTWRRIDKAWAIEHGTEERHGNNKQRKR